MSRWDVNSLNSFSGPALALQTVYEQRYMRAALRKVIGRVRRADGGTGVEFGAGYGRMTTGLCEFFGRAVGLEREAELIKVGTTFSAADIELVKVETLASVPLAEGGAALSFTCCVMQHMLDEEVAEVLAEMRRVSRGGFVLLTESTFAGYVDGNYGPTQYFTKGRTVAEYEKLMKPFVLDFARPRHIGDLTGPVWGSIMMFRAPGVAEVGNIERNGNWRRAEIQLN